MTLKICFITGLFMLIVISCKTKPSYDEVSYHKIMDESVQLFAKQEVGKDTGNAVAIDTTSEVYKKFKAQIDSVDAVRTKYLHSFKTKSR